MHILLVSKLSFSSSLGGAEVVIRMLCRGLVGKGHRITFLSFDQDAESGPHENAVVTQINHPPMLYKLSSYKRLNGIIESVGAGPADRSLDVFNKLLDRQTFDVVNTHQLTGIDRRIWRDAAARKLPVVHTIHDYSLLCTLGSMYRGHTRCVNQCLFCRIWSTNNRRLSEYVYAVIACSQFILSRHLHCGLFANSYKEVIYPASIKRGCPSMSNVVRPRKPLRLGFIGRLHRVKGLNRLFALLRATIMPSYELWIAGIGNQHYTALLKRSATGLPVRWIGWLDREIFFSEIDVLVVPSLWDEPAGLVLTEAMHHGVPTLASDRGGLREIGGEHQLVYLFDPDCHQSFRVALDQAVAKLGTNMSTSFREQPCYVEDLVESYEDVLKRVVPF
jgi:glycosyltransferase involved in cell wall biosynthesis